MSNDKPKASAEAPSLDAAGEADERPHWMRADIECPYCDKKLQLFGEWHKTSCQGVVYYVRCRRASKGAAELRPQDKEKTDVD